MNMAAGILDQKETAPGPGLILSFQGLGFRSQFGGQNLATFKSLQGFTGVFGFITLNNPTVGRRMTPDSGVDLSPKRFDGLLCGSWPEILAEATLGGFFA
jgi:hypothetical protein